MLGQLGNSLLCKGHTLLAFEVEGLGYHCYGQDAQIFGNFRNDRRSARTCTTAHTGSDKHHVCAIQGGAQRFASQVGDTMTARLETLRPGDSVQALRSTLDRGLTAVVADSAQFYGLITRYDLLNHLRRKL